jgi:hypothetical protein
MSWWVDELMNGCADRGFFHWTTDFVSFYVCLGREFAPKTNMECIFFIAPPVLTIGVAIIYSFVLCSLTAFWWPGGSRASDWTLVVLPALPRLRTVHCVAVSFAALNKQTNKHVLKLGCWHDDTHVGDIDGTCAAVLTSCVVRRWWWLCCVDVSMC